MNDSYVKVILASIIWGTIGIFACWSEADPLLLSFTFFSDRSGTAIFLYCRCEGLPLIRAREFFPVIIMAYSGCRFIFLFCCYKFNLIVLYVNNILPGFRYDSPIWAVVYRNSKTMYVLY